MSKTTKSTDIAIKSGIVTAVTYVLLSLIYALTKASDYMNGTILASLVIGVVLTPLYLSRK